MQRFATLAITVSVLCGAQVVSSFARAQGVAFPNFNTEASCAASPAPHGCQKLESMARGKLQTLWPTLSSARRAQCVAVGRSQGDSYVAALGCAS